jgi:uncharacterized membrane protein (DUF485 family)
MLIDICMCLGIGSLFWLIFLFFNMPYFIESSIDNPFTETKYFPIGTWIFIIVFFIIGIFYTPYNKQFDVEKLVVQSECNLNNILTLANNINEKAIVKTEDDRIIVDVANFSQSTITSGVYVSYVNEVNRYNKELAEFKVKSKRSIMNILIFGWYPEIPESLKYIKIKF